MIEFEKKYRIEDEKRGEEVERWEVVDILCRRRVERFGRVMVGYSRLLNLELLLESFGSC